MGIARDTSVELLCGDYRSLLPSCLLPADQLVIVFISPPWVDALDAHTGLDLRRTTPPIHEVIATFDDAHRDGPILYVTQVRQPLERASVAELASQFAWSQLRIYDINVEGMKHGVLLGSRRWVPDSDAP